MSIDTSDLIHIPYDASLSLAGAIYACRTLQHMLPRLGRLSPHQMRRTSVNIAAHLALRRWLESTDVPYDLIQASPITQPERPALVVGGRRVYIQNTFIPSKHHIRRLRRNLSWLLEMNAILPEDQLALEDLGEGDLLVFAFITGLETRSRAGLQRALAAQQTSYLIAIPARIWWQREKDAQPLGPLIVDSADPTTLNLEYGATLFDNRYRVEQLSIPPMQQSMTPHHLSSLFYIHSSNLPEGDLSIRCPSLDQNWVVASNDWANIWVYGIEITFAGWSTKGAFRKSTQRFPRGTRTQIGHRTRVDSRAKAVSQLRPLLEIVHRIRQG
jgi:hypothetical protein